MPLAPHDEAGLGVNLVADQAVDHMHAILFQAPRPLDVVRFIEARAQFHHGGDLLAVVHGVFERADDARIAAGAIERLFNGQDVRVRREPSSRNPTTLLKFSLRVMQQNIALANGREQIRLAAQRGRDGRDERLVTQLGRMIALRHRNQARGIQRAVHQIQIVL